MTSDEVLMFLCSMKYCNFVSDLSVSTVYFCAESWLGSGTFAGAATCQPPEEGLWVSSLAGGWGPRAGFL